MIVELYAKSDVGRVRRGNEDNFLVLDLSSEQTWTGADGTPAPANLTRFDLGDKGLVLVVSDGMGGALAGDDDLPRRVAVGDDEDAVLRGRLDQFGESRIVEPDQGCHGPVASLPRCLHQPATLSDEPDAIREVEGAGGDECRVLAHRVTSDK